MKYLRSIIIALMMVFVAQQGFAQIVAPVGISSRASSQLIYWYDNVGDGAGATASVAQVTNTNDSTPVTIHVQIFRSFDPDGTPANGNEVICDERDFVDVLTPNDTHIYVLNREEFEKNIGEAEGTAGERTSIDVSDTKGFVIITPIVSESDFTAISFQYLIGSMGLYDEPARGYRLDAMGRDAVDFTTGEIVADGTPLDGTTNGYVVLQPEELSFNFAQNDDDGSYVVGINFIDAYGPAGLLGYNITPGSTTWTSFIYDWKEDPTSCGNRPNNCFMSIGVDDEIYDANQELDDALLCDSVDLTDYPEYGTPELGWARIFVSGYEPLENQLGIAAFFEPAENEAGADWMFTKGQRTEIEPPPTEEICDMEGDEDGDGFADCLDTDCATAENCETGPEECTDGIDNDEDGATDCADLGCDGTVIDSEAGIACETGGETSCNDGFDNDGDGDVDGADSDCQTADTGGTTGDDGGDGGGCTVATSVTTATAAANFLLPLLPLFGAYGIRRIRNRK